MNKKEKEIVGNFEYRFGLKPIQLAKITVKKDETIILNNDLDSKDKGETILKEGTYIIVISPQYNGAAFEVLTLDNAKKEFFQCDLENVKDLTEAGYKDIKDIEDSRPGIKHGYLYEEDFRSVTLKKKFLGNGGIVSKDGVQHLINNLSKQYKETSNAELALVELNELKTYISIKHNNNKEIIDEINIALSQNYYFKNIKINDEGDITVEGDIQTIPDSNKGKKASSLEDILDDLMLNEPTIKDLPIEKPDDTINQKDILKIASKVKKIKKVDWEIE